MLRSIGYFYPIIQGDFYAITYSAASGIFPLMETSFKTALDHALKATNRSLRSVAIQSGVSYDQLKGLMQGKSQRTNFDDGVRVAKVFGVSVEDFLLGNLQAAPRSVSVAGRVGAGAEIDLCDAYAKGDGLYHVACPAEVSPHGIVAVEVMGESMEPMFFDGDVLFYSRAAAEGVPIEAIGRQVVAQTDDGRVWVKQLKIGTAPGLFHLLSLNPAGANLLDVKVTWAAAVRLHLPKALVRKVE
ncbi:MAG: S24 family peptidase [Paracoccaceae bacterium]|nr:S24 family peptidase [Paracoccaceae bacterium]